MKLAYYCKNCNSKNVVSLPVTNRFQVKDMYGEKIEMACQKCSKSIKYSPNNLNAIPGILPTVIAVISLFASIILLNDWLMELFAENKSQMNKWPWTYLELLIVLIIPILVFVVLKYEQAKRLRIFNGSRI